MRAHIRVPAGGARRLPLEPRWERGEAFPRGVSVGALAGGEDFNAPSVFSW